MPIALSVESGHGLPSTTALQGFVPRRLRHVGRLAASDLRLRGAGTARVNRLQCIAHVHSWNMVSIKCSNTRASKLDTKPAHTARSLKPQIPDVATRASGEFRHADVRRSGSIVLFQVTSDRNLSTSSPVKPRSIHHEFQAWARRYTAARTGSAREHGEVHFAHGRRCCTSL